VENIFFPTNRTITQGQTFTVSTTDISGATYTWQIPEGLTIDGERNGHRITVIATTVRSYPASDFKVTPTRNGCSGTTLAGTGGNIIVVSGTPATTVAIDQNDGHVFTNIGETYQFTATTDPIGVPVLWYSDNPAFFPVDKDGIVTANGYGAATITAYTADGGVDRRQVSFSQVLLESMTIEIPGHIPPTVVTTNIHPGSFSINVKVGETIEIITQVTPSDAGAINILGVSPAGLVTADRVAHTVTFVEPLRPGDPLATIIAGVRGNVMNAGGTAVVVGGRLIVIQARVDIP
jgi:uncharacterized protein YjdB